MPKDIIGCTGKCIDYRGPKGLFGEGSVQLVLNPDNGKFYLDKDRFNPHEFPVGTVGHLFLEVLMQPVGPGRPGMLDRASNVRDSYKRW